MLVQEAGQALRRCQVAIPGQVRGRFDPRLLVYGRVLVVAQFQHRVATQNLVQLLHRGKAAPRRQQGAPWVDAVFLEARVDLFPEVAGGTVMIAAGDNRGVFRQVIEERGAALEKQRQVVLAAPRAAPGADLHVGGAEIRVHLETVVPVHLETADGAAIQGVFTGRQQADGLHLFHGALGLRVETAQAVDLVVQQVDPVGQFAAHGVDIQQGAAQGELAVLVDGLHVHIAVALQVATKAVYVQGLPGFQYQAGTGDILGGRQAVHQGRDRDHQDARGRRREPVQGIQALGNDVLVRGKIIVGQGFPIREGQHLHRLVQEEWQFPLQGQCRAGVRGNHHQQAPGLGQFGDATGIGAAGEGAQGRARGCLQGPWGA